MRAEGPLSGHGSRPSFPLATHLAEEPRVLVVYCHPQGHRSRVNRELRAAVTGLSGVTVHDLYERYPDGGIDVPFEQELLLAHRALVLQHPFYWYSTPPLLKEWLDVVLEWGWAYGRGGAKLRGKPMLQAITTGAQHQAYGPSGGNRFTIRELLAPMAATANLCGMPFKDPFVVHGTHRLDEAAIAGAAQDYKRAVEALRDEVSR